MLDNNGRGEIIKDGAMEGPSIVCREGVETH